MSKKYTFSVIGGDHRQIEIIKRLILGGHRVKVFSLCVPSGQIAGAEICSSIEKSLGGSDFTLLPLPITRDGVNINLTESAREVAADAVISRIAKDKTPLIFGGLIPERLRENAKKSGIDLIDYYNNEELQQKNALPSAEGAIMVAMENTDRVIEGMRVLVCGYGRIGKILAHKLRLLGASVAVAARRDEILCEIAINGLIPIDIRSTDDLATASSNCDVIFNTVPEQIFTRQTVGRICTNPLYIEIASSPGGIDIQAAREFGVRMIFAPSLPGRYAPASAGEYIFDSIKDILCKRGIEI